MPPLKDKVPPRGFDWFIPQLEVEPPSLGQQVVEETFILQIRTETLSVPLVIRVVVIEFRRWA